MLEILENQLVARYDKRDVRRAGTGVLSIGLLGVVMSFFLQGGPHPTAILGSIVSVLVGAGIIWAATPQITTIEKSGKTTISDGPRFGRPSQERSFNTAEFAGVDYFEYSHGEVFLWNRGSKVSLVLPDKSRLKILDQNMALGPLRQEATQIAEFLGIPLHVGTGEWRQLGS